MPHLEENVHWIAVNILYAVILQQLSDIYLLNSGNVWLMLGICSSFQYCQLCPNQSQGIFFFFPSIYFSGSSLENVISTHFNPASARSDPEGVIAPALSQVCHAQITKFLRIGSITSCIMVL